MDQEKIDDNIDERVRSNETLCQKVYVSCCHPSGKVHRCIVLIFMCFLGFGPNFCYDNPGALQEHFKNDLNITETQFTGLYSIYSWPNIVLCFIGGFMLDRVFGIVAGTNIFIGITLAGQLVFALAVYLNQYWLMICGRFIFGAGTESLFVAQNNYAVLWFSGQALNMVFGLQATFARVGSTVNFLIMERIYAWLASSVTGSHILGNALFIATSMCILSSICSIILGLMEKRADNILRRSQNQDTTEIVRMTDIKGFKASFWLTCLISVTYFMAIYPFINIGQDYFKTRFHMNDKEADQINSLVYLISAIASPFTGLIIDNVGLNISWILLFILASIIAHILLGFTLISPYIGVATLGIAFSGAASGVWPLIALITPEYQLGTAYGVCQSISNGGLAIGTIAIGMIQQAWGYGAVSGFFLCNLIVAFILTTILLHLDRRSSGILNSTATSRRHRYLMSLFLALQYTMVSDIVQHFISENIVPESLDVAPPSKMTVTYPGNKEVNFNELTPTDVKSQPQVTWETDPNALYTLSMVDPDAPSRVTPTFREINHWLVINVKGADLATGQTVVSYRGSGPPKGTGRHRYIFLAFKQQSAISVESDLEADRRNFSIRQFAKKFNLGNPVAGNFYQAQWDESVGERKK